jgi:superfamily II DNA/RNA helicase
MQYNPPCETKDYIHRAGRLARAGQAGHALLFLLPLERQYIEVLELCSLRDISPLSLSSTLSVAGALCKGMMRESKSRASTGRNASPEGRAKAFTYAIQSRLKECIITTIWGQGYMPWPCSIYISPSASPHVRAHSKYYLQVVSNI